MARIPRPHNSDPDQDDPPRRVGRAGLDALMRDPRHWDGQHPDHARLVDTVRRGFELVFAAPKRTAFNPISAGNGAPTPVTDSDGPFARTLSRLNARDDDLDALPVTARGALGRRAILAALKQDGHRLPPGLDEDEDEDDGGIALAAAQGPETDEDEEDGRGDRTPDEADLPMHPLDENGKEIPPHPDDPRFNPDGSPKEEWFGNNEARRWAGRNSRYNPETGEFEYYSDLPDYHRDPDTGRWRRAAPLEKSENLPNDDERDEGLPSNPENDPPDVPRPDPPGPPYLPLLPPIFGRCLPRPRRR